MAKIALLGDTHFGARGDCQFFHEYFFRFYDEVFFPYLKEHGIKKVYQFGDLMDRRKFINFVTLYSMKRKFIDKFVDDLSLCVLLGNHDIYYKNTNKVNSLTELFGNLSDTYNIKIIDSPETVIEGNLSIDIIPWINPENFADTMAFMEKTNSDYCFGHFEISGFEMYRGLKSQDGFSTKIFRTYKGVYSGHYHTRSNKGNITYLGTPYEITWADYDDPRGFYVMDTDNGMVEFIKNPFRMHHKVYYDDTLENFDEHDVQQYKDTIVKVVITKKENHEMFERFIERLDKVGLNDLTTLEASVDHGDDDIGEIETEDTLTILFKSVDILDGDSRLSKDELKKHLKTLYNEALEQVMEK